MKTPKGQFYAVLRVAQFYAVLRVNLKNIKIFLYGGKKVDIIVYMDKIKILRENSS